MRRHALALNILTLGTLLAFTAAWAAPPAAVAETVRGALVDAQVALMVAPDAAAAPLREAERAYAGLGLGRLEPTLDLDRVLVSLVRTRGAWKVSELDAL